MKLYTVGPTEMFDSTLEVASKQLPYFRSDEFSKIVLDSVKKMKELLNAEEDSKVIYITGSGSAAMEAIVSNSFDSNDRLLIIDGGTFGHRFTQIADVYKIPYDSIKLEYGDVLSKKHFDSLNLDIYTALLVNIDETSTGQLYDINLISKICKEHKMYLIVDAISSFLADEYDMKKYNIDCTIISSQKALALSPGLSILAINNNFYESKIKDREPINLYLNINEHVKNMERGQTPNTPAVGIILELSDRISKIKNSEDEVRRVRKNAEYFRKLALENNLKIPDFPISNALTPIMLEKENATEVFNYLKDKYGIFVNPTGGQLAKKTLRISHIGNLSFEDYDFLIEKMKEVI